MDGEVGCARFRLAVPADSRPNSNQCRPFCIISSWTLLLLVPTVLPEIPSWRYNRLLGSNVGFAQLTYSIHRLILIYVLFRLMLINHCSNATFSWSIKYLNSFFLLVWGTTPIQFILTVLERVIESQKKINRNGRIKRKSWYPQKVHLRTYLKFQQFNASIPNRKVVGIEKSHSSTNLINTKLLTLKTEIKSWKQMLGISKFT